MGLEVGKHCAGDAAKEDVGIPGADFVGAHINGELTFYREAYIDDILDMPKSEGEKMQTPGKQRKRRGKRH
jgi:hypothetical protein